MQAGIGVDSVPVDARPQARVRPGPDGRVAGSGASRPGSIIPGWLGDGRGLTASGAVLLAAGSGLAGVGIDAATGTGLGKAFAVLFVLGCAGAAAVVHHEDLLAAVAMPPLLLVALAAIASMIDGAGPGGSWLARRALDVVTAVVTDAPVLFVAVAAVVVVVGLRFVRYRASVRRRRAVTRPPAGRPAASA